MKITVEFDNGPALVVAPSQLQLQQWTADKLTLSVQCGTYALPVAEFSGSLATADEVELRTKKELITAFADGKIPTEDEVQNIRTKYKPLSNDDVQ